MPDLPRPDVDPLPGDTPQVQRFVVEAPRAHGQCRVESHAHLILPCLPARQDDLLAHLVRLRAPGSLLRALAALEYDHVYTTVEEVVRHCAREVGDDGHPPATTVPLDDGGPPPMPVDQ